MSQKDYKAIAAAFASTRPFNVDTPQFLQWQKDVDAIARVFAADNPRFSWSRFIDACGDHTQ